MWLEIFDPRIQGLVLLVAVLSEFITFPMLFYSFEHETLCDIDIDQEFMHLDVC